MDEASSELEREIERCQVSRHVPSRNWLQAGGASDDEGRGFIEPGSFKVTLETEGTVTLRKGLRYCSGGGPGFEKRSSGLRRFTIYRVSRYVNVPARRDGEVENVTSK